MYETNRSIRDALSQPKLRLVRVLPHAFQVQDEELTELRGRVHRVHLVRKLFEDGSLVCDSKDGYLARNGTKCEDCLHPRCRTLLRLYLDCGDGLALIDLNPTSAQNFFEIEDVAREAQLDLRKLDLCLSVTNQRHWGEVRFTFADRL